VSSAHKSAALTSPGPLTRLSVGTTRAKRICSWHPGGRCTHDLRDYYTLHVLNDGQIEGMLSVNGYRGQVWYHSWHGQFVNMIELDEA